RDWEKRFATRDNRDVVIEFFINKKGELGGLQYRNHHSGYYLKQKLEKKFKKMKKWNPAIVNGRAVASRVVIPIARNKKASQLKTKFIKTPVFYAPQYIAQRPIIKRTDFRSTVYWNPSVTTDKDGKASLEFWNSDDLTTLEARIEGFSNLSAGNGFAGEGVHTYSVQMPFSLSAKMPVILLEGDEVRIPITLSNNTDEILDGNLDMEVPPCFKAKNNNASTYRLAARESKTIYPTFEVVNGANAKQVKKAQIQFSFKSDKLQDHFSQLVRFQSDGYPISEVLTGTKSNNTFTLNINELRNGTIKTQLKAHTNIVSDIMSTTERMLRQPSGCFEQTSSSNYPNVLVMQYLKKHQDQPNHIVMQKAEGFLESGYKRLTGYEVRGGGFDWFGQGPSHEALTAYGILQFTDMAKVYPVEQAMLDRTVKWLLTRRDKDGGWAKGKRGLHSWAATPDIRNAYINWSLAEAGHANKIGKEITASYKTALTSDDPYIVALVVNTLLAAKDNRANKLMDKLKDAQNEDGSFTGKTYTVVNSKGKVQSLETTALASLALLNGDSESNDAASKAIQFIANSKTAYGFGSTQSTVLCIKALLAFAEQSSNTINEGTIALHINDKLIEEIPFSTKQSKELAFKDFSHLLKEGEQKLEVRFSKGAEIIPFELLVDYSSVLPAQNENQCKLSLTTNLSDESVPQGETTRLTTRLVNEENEIITSPIAIVGIPSGLSPQPWQLKKLQEEEVIAYYEIIDNRVVFYLRELAPNATKEIHLDLKADVPGRYLSPASKAYLYYENDAVSWVAPVGILVEEG
ncbi:MAG: alpha-2-macroglobulin family protein, partial [Saprospiraceae bacterium]